MKRALKILVISMAVTLFLGIMPTIAFADGEDWVGVVIAQRITQRETKSLGGKLVQNISNGSEVEILASEDGWFHVNFNGLEGWVVSDYVVENPVYITLRNSSTPAYSYPNQSSKKVGSLVSYTRLTVISETDNYYVVNLRQASAFISKKASVWTDEDINNWLLHPATAGTVNKKTTLRTGPGTSWNNEGSLNEGTSVSILGSENGWYVITHDKGIVYINMNDVTAAPEG